MKIVFICKWIGTQVLNEKPKSAIELPEEITQISLIFEAKFDLRLHLENVIVWLLAMFLYNQDVMSQVFQYCIG